MAGKETKFERAAKEASKILKQEELILDVARVLSEFMLAGGLTKSGVAKLMGQNESFVNGILTGRNVTLRTLADFCDAIGAKPKFTLTRK